MRSSMPMPSLADAIAAARNGDSPATSLARGIEFFLDEVERCGHELDSMEGELLAELLAHLADRHHDEDGLWPEKLFADVLQRPRRAGKPLTILEYRTLLKMVRDGDLRVVRERGPSSS